MGRPWYIVARERARKVGVSYQHIADALSVSKSTVGHWMTGRNRPRLEQIARIANLLGTAVTTLIEEDAYFLTNPEERRMIDVLRSIPAEHQAQAIDMLAAFATSIRSRETPH